MLNDNWYNDMSQILHTYLNLDEIIYKRFLILNENNLQKIIKGPASLSLVQIEMFVLHTLIKIRDVFCFQYHSDIWNSGKIVEC